MVTGNLNDSVNQFPAYEISQEVERTLCLWAWKDENFREALIADPKAVIQQVFPHCFPHGKAPDDLTIKVVEQDPFTRHIVLPAFADEELTLEIPEEEQVDCKSGRARQA